MAKMIGNKPYKLEGFCMKAMGNHGSAKGYIEIKRRNV